MNRTDQIKHAIMESVAFNESHAFAADYMRNCSLPRVEPEIDDPFLAVRNWINIRVVSDHASLTSRSSIAYVLRAFDEK